MPQQKALSEPNMSGFKFEFEEAPGVQVHSTQIDGKLCKITALARCPISHSQLYLMGHEVLQ